MARRLWGQDCHKNYDKLKTTEIRELVVMALKVEPYYVIICYCKHEEMIVITVSPVTCL